MGKNGTPSWKYNSEEQPSLQTGDITYLVIRSLLSCAISANKANSAIGNEWFFPTSQVTAKVIDIANTEEVDIDTNHVTPKTVGRIIGKLRFESKRPDGSKPRGWIVSRYGLERLCTSYGIIFPEVINTQKDDGTNGIDGTNGTNQISIEKFLDNIFSSDVTKPCYACGRMAWQERSREAGGGFFCGVCHPPG